MVLLRMGYFPFTLSTHSWPERSEGFGLCFAVQASQVLWLHECLKGIWKEKKSNQNCSHGHKETSF